MASPAVRAEDSENNTLSKMETQLFGRVYASDFPSDRLSRVEQEVFGRDHPEQSDDQRLTALKPFFNTPRISKSDFLMLPASPPKVIKAPSQKPGSINSGGPPAASASNERYPVVTRMEQTATGKSFEKDPLDTRLARLEAHVFGQPQTGSLQDRTDRLREVLLKETAPVVGDSYLPNEEMSNNPSQASPSALASLPKIEQRLFHQSYPMESPEARIERIEMKLFNATAPEMTLDERVLRVGSVVTAKDSARKEDLALSGPFGNSRGGVQRSAGGVVISSGGYGKREIINTMLMILMSLF